jgi:predicted DNA-binding transcriptional regulator YafY
MNTKIASVSPLMLTEEEAFGLLDMCLMSNTEMDCYKEAAMQKLKEVIYGFFEQEASAAPEFDEEREPSLPMTDVLACIEANEPENMDTIEAAVRLSMREHTGRVFFRELMAK